MNLSALIFNIVGLSLAWWLGLYLLARNPAAEKIRFTGLGLVIYALGLTLDLLAEEAGDPDLADSLRRWGWPLLFLPTFFWLAGLYFLLFEDKGWPGWLKPIIKFGFPVMALLFLVLSGGTELVTSATDEGRQPGPWYIPVAAAVLFDLLLAVLLAARSFGQSGAGRSRTLILVATLFFGLGTGLLLFPLDVLPRWLMLVAVAIDLLIFGLAVGVLDAFEQGETLLPDLARSLAFSLIIAAMFGGQVLLVMALSTGLTLSMLVLLLATIMTAILTQTFSDPIQSGLDWLVFARIPRIRETRADLRAAASGAPRTPTSFDPHSLTDGQFAKLTRRALGQMGNLPRLATSPLTRLPIVEARLVQANLPDGTLERASELKALLAESIDRLKPRGQGEFGTADEWRHYNALYFPYVAGLKPYSRRAFYEDLEASSQSALEWFRSQVPERTLYNWQNAAARLIATDLKEQSRTQD